MQWRAGVTNTFLIWIHFLFQIPVPTLRVCASVLLGHLLSMSLLWRYPTVPGIYVSRYIECSSRRFPPANTIRLTPSSVFLCVTQLPSKTLTSHSETLTSHLFDGYKLSLSISLNLSLSLRRHVTWTTSGLITQNTQ